jgi:PTS system ascorbate-specific IIC component
MGFIEFFISILSTPAILVGIFAMLGHILQKNPIEDVVRGTFKTIVGFLVLSGGAAYLISATGPLTNFGVLFYAAFGVTGMTQNNEAVVAIALKDVASTTAYIMVIAMIANLFLARFSKMKYIFLTGHHTLYMGCLVAVVLNYAGLAQWQTIIAGGLIVGLMQVLMPALAESTMTKVTDGADIALGHFGTLGYFISGQIGKVVKGKKSTEEINFPERLIFMRDTIVAISITMGFFFLVISVVAAAKGQFAPDGQLYGLLAGEGGLHTSWIVWALIQGLSFAAGVTIILTGIRFILGEIVPAFKGIAEKIVPNAKPALDCPITFSFAPNAVLIGFLSSYVGGIVSLAIIIGINAAAGTAVLVLMLPGVINHFFCGATAGVFGNAEGGLRGCIIGSFIHGIVITVLPVALMIILGQILGQGGTTFGDSDFGLVGITLGGLSLFIKSWGLFIICVILFFIPLIVSPFIKEKKK